MKSIKIAIYVFLIIGMMMSLYVFSRFTVDDAFLSWRYGKNLIDFGIWNFNPSKLDPTQAYTNPIYALLSIIPAYFKWDVVLFFKIISSILLILFLYWSLKITKKSYLLVLSFLAIPATIIHIYSGLETFSFVFLMAALLISMYEEKKRTSVILTLFLFLTRPESYLLVILLPIYYLIIEPKPASIKLINPFTYLKTLKYLPAQAVSILIATAIPLLAYFLFHYIHFGNILPNTFYAKSSSSFNFSNFIKYSVFTKLSQLQVL